MSTMVKLTAEEVERRRQRNRAIALLLLGMVALFFTITIVKLGGNVAERQSFPIIDRYGNDSTP